ncbi:hypothetical protein Pcinc_003039 [Petrolisthes cinctipes]|uniref:Uncharacterized protein n=1 Tax=Petrolisthes cinctipes TaxID=88211 RepID=A0AAE1GK53_PETCI|nr:hypothetical protein Pcinc_003039 [Petrolisthes cinctipes]
MDSGSSGNESLRRKRGAAKAKFRRKVKFFHAHVEKESSSEVLRWIFEDVEKSFDEIESIHMQLIQQRDSTSMDNEDQYMEMLEDERIEVRCLLDTKLGNKSVKKDQTTVKLKPFDPPLFSGNVRDWPTFKETFNKLVVPQCGKEPYALLQCLESEAKKLVRGVEDDFSAMMARLEEEYSHIGRILESILRDIRKLKPISEERERSNTHTHTDRLCVHGRDNKSVNNNNTKMIRV